MKLGNLMKQAQEMQAKMEKAQAELENIEVEGAAGAGMVKVTMNARGDFRGIKLDPSIVNADEVEILEDLILAACNDARDKAAVKSSEEMKNVASGLPIPPGMNLPF